MLFGEYMIDILLKFTKKAGKKLKGRHNNIEKLGNKDSSVQSLVTKADLEISALFEKMVKKNFSDYNYLIIDEETISLHEPHIFEKINKSEYQFVIDPIDGTLQYANNQPLYGISIGVYKHTYPLLGIIYLPALNELIYFDGKKAYWVQNAFSSKSFKTELLPRHYSTSNIIFGHSWMWRFTEKFSTDQIVFLNYYSAVSQSFYPLIGKAKAYCMNLKLWDIAGTIPIANYLGMKIFEYGSSIVYDSISSKYFTENLSTKKHCILCYPDDFKYISSLLEPNLFHI